MKRIRSELVPWIMVVLCLPIIGAAERCAAGPREDGASLQEGYVRRYQGVRWRMAYESCTGVQAFGVQELYGVIQEMVPYVVEVADPTDLRITGYDTILIGTAAGNAEINKMIAVGLIKPPVREQGYTITSLDSTAYGGNRVIVIAGFDKHGVAYGACELCKRLLRVPRETPNGVPQDPLSVLKDLQVSEAPAIESRGIWTWGYTIYDYPRFLDNMVRLKFNKIVVWNDIPPRNAADFIEYAHNRGIKVVFGFHWGWGVTNLDPSNNAQLDAVKRHVLETYRKALQPLKIDGIYFQTFTETSETRVGSQTIAALYCGWVNDIAGALLKLEPTLNIEAGLHATSVRNDLNELKGLNPRVGIVWEDAGVIPWLYYPLREPPKGKVPEEWDTPEKTLDFAKRLAVLRAPAGFQMVAKGWTNLRWATEFEHHGNFLIGVRSREFVTARYGERKSRWDYVNTLWLENYPLYQRFFTEIRKTSPQPMTVLALVEDGVLEEKIEPSVALGAELLWNSNRPADEILQCALSPYFSGCRR